MMPMSGRTNPSRPRSATLPPAKPLLRAKNTQTRQLTTAERKPVPHGQMMEFTANIEGTVLVRHSDRRHLARDDEGLGGTGVSACAQGVPNV